METHRHVSELESRILAMPVPQGARPQDECPKCGGLEWKGLYFNNKNNKQVRVQCLRTDCKHKFQRFSFRKSHPDGYKKAKAMEPEEYVGLVKVCSSCGCSNAKFYGINNKDVQQARYKCLNSECKKLFMPFSKPRANVKRSTTAENLPVVDDNKVVDGSIVNNNLQYYSTTVDSQYPTSFVNHVVDPTMPVPCARNAFQNNNIDDEEERARLTPLVDPLHEYFVQQDDPIYDWPTPALWNTQSEDHDATILTPPTPTTTLQEARLTPLGYPYHKYFVQQDDPVLYDWPIPAPWNTQSEDHDATILMPPTPTTTLQEVCNSEDHMPNLTSTTISQEEEPIVQDPPTTEQLSTTLHEDEEPGSWSIPADFEYWNEMINTDLTFSTNASDTLFLEEELNARSYRSSLMNP